MIKMPQTDAEWDASAAALGLASGSELRAQVALSEEIIAEVIAEEKATAHIPEVCDSFEYKGSSFRTQGHVKFVRNSALGGKWWLYVTREEATHVVGYGVCGCIAPVGEIKRTGTVEWSPEMIAEEQARAAKRIGEKVLA